MHDNFSKVFLALGLMLCGAFALSLAVVRPAYLSSYTYLGALAFLEVLTIVLWKFEKRFFPFLMLVFLLAGMSLPFRSVWTTARWIVLAVGAIGGCVMYLKGRHHSFGVFHLLAFFCVVAGLVSAMVSLYPRVALLKLLSLFLLFVYAATGARAAVIGREAQFFKGLLLGCELLVYFSAGCYFILHLEIYGNPNSLGLLMGVVAAPVLLWGVFISQGTRLGMRRSFALVLCLLLLLSSYARSAIVAAGVSCLLLCLVLRQYRLLIKGLGVAVLAAVAVAALVPVMPFRRGPSESFVSSFLYKGDPHGGIMGSRATPWEKTSSVIRSHPWFGGGFGTSATASDLKAGSLESTSADSREHGSSYLTIVEWVGLCGVLPFFAILGMIIVDLGHVAAWVRRTGSPFSPVVPLATVLLAGLIHAAFEDWLFAVGYYMSVFFWAAAFVLADILRSPTQLPERSESAYSSNAWAGGYGIATSGQ
jgi:O-antigen ligase